MEKNLQKAIESIQHSHLIGLSLVNFIIFAFYYFIYTGPGIKGHMPLYMKIYLIGSLLLWLLLYLQEREYIFKIIIENYKFRVAIYMTINLLSGYNIPF